MPNGFVVAHRPGAATVHHTALGAPPARFDRPLMADLARMAGVSISTVSRALRGDPMVAAATRHRIEALALSMHYRVDERARSLRLRQNHMVAVVVPKGLRPGDRWADPFSLELLDSIADALADQGHTMLLSRPDRLQPAALSRDVEAGQARGLIIVGEVADDGALDALARRGVPLVVWGVRRDGQAHASVCSDNLIGGRLATGHLLDRGARQVAFIGDIRQPEMALRHAGHLQAHRVRGVMPLAATAPPWPDPLADPMDLVAGWLEQAPGIDAIVAGNDLLAMGVVHGLRCLGRRVPEDILVVGHGNTGLAAQFHPPLTSVCPSTGLAGAALVQALQVMIDGGRPADTLLPTRLQVRQSSGGERRAHRQTDAPHG